MKTLAKLKAVFLALALVLIIVGTVCLVVKIPFGTKKWNPGTSDGSVKPHYEETTPYKTAAAICYVSGGACAVLFVLSAVNDKKDDK